MIKHWREKYVGITTDTIEAAHPQSSFTKLETHDCAESQEFPIKEMATTFVQWFFEMYNTDELKPNDFWPDAMCTVELKDSQQIDRQSANNDNYVLELLTQIRSQYRFYFNANTMADGTQGRMNRHGMVYVLNCGTLHIQDTQQCVGVYECSFGLVRDPFTDNNWKMKIVQLRLRSTVEANDRPPQLHECESLQEMLALPDVGTQ